MTPHCLGLSDAEGVRCSAQCLAPSSFLLMSGLQSHPVPGRWSLDREEEETSGLAALRCSF